jgi:hypothetical protein
MRKFLVLLAVLAAMMLASVKAVEVPFIAAIGGAMYFGFKRLRGRTSSR